MSWSSQDYNSKVDSSSVFLSSIKLTIASQFKHLCNILNNKGNNSSLFEDRAQRAIGSSNEVTSLCDVFILRSAQISDMILLYHTNFIPGLRYGCEAGQVYAQMIMQNFSNHTCLF